MSLFRRSARTDAAATLASALGRALVAARLQSGDAVPADAILVTFDGGGRARRSLGPHAAFKPAARGNRLALDAGETAFCFHPGPYDALLIPYEAAPELGLRLRFVIDAGDPRVEQQRFDLFLHSEAGERLTLDDLAAQVQSALRLALGQGNLALPPCAALDEWDGFRAGLNQLLYTRFGLTVEDCLPADLGGEVDFAAMLARRAHAPAPVISGSVQDGGAVLPDASADGEDAAAMAAPSSLRGIFSAAFAAKSAALNAASAAAVAAEGPGTIDARAQRRLFLELPAATAALRQLPEASGRFGARQGLLTRCEMASLRVATMPSLAWAAPDQPLALPQQRRRADASVLAVAALDEAWALLARWQLAASGAEENEPLFDEAGRILSNLEAALAARHAASAPLEAPAPETPVEQRREPT